MAHYELPTRLANANQQSAIASIIGIPNASLNNTKEIARPPGGGAGRVNQFRGRSDALPLTRPPVPPVSNSTSQGGAAQGIQPTATDQRSEIELSLTRGESEEVAGYAALSSFMSSDKVFSVFRRFDNLSTRNLLSLQDELSELEERLAEIDRADLESGIHANLVSLHSRRHDANNGRRAAMSELKIKIGEYQGALDQHSRALALPKPASIYTDSLVNWIDGMKPIIEAESHFLDTPRDLVSLSSLPGQERGNATLENWMEKRYGHLFSTKKHRNRLHADSHAYYYSQTTIRRVVRSLLTVIAVIILVGPIFALYYIKNPLVKLVLIGVFSFCFAIALALWTKSQNHEIFAAIAAYCAVLVVFVGNLPTLEG